MSKISEKLKAIAAAVAGIEKQFGRGAIMQLGGAVEDQKIAVIPTGSVGLDRALGVGGYPRGRVVEIFGNESFVRVLDTTGARVLITSSDGTIALIRQHREQLEQRVRIALAKEAALSIAVNKEHTLAIAKQLGVGIPRGVTVGAVSEVEAALREIGLPAVVKPVESWVGDIRQPRLTQLAKTFMRQHVPPPRKEKPTGWA